MLYKWISLSSAIAKRLASAFKEAAPGSVGSEILACSLPHSAGWPAAHVAGVVPSREWKSFSIA